MASSGSRRLDLERRGGAARGRLGRRFLIGVERPRHDERHPAQHQHQGHEPPEDEEHRPLLVAAVGRQPRGKYPGGAGGGRYPPGGGGGRLPVGAGRWVGHGDSWSFETLASGHCDAGSPRPLQVGYEFATTADADLPRPQCRRSMFRAGRASGPETGVPPCEPVAVFAAELAEDPALLMMIHPIVSMSDAKTCTATGVFPPCTARPRDHARALHTPCPPTRPHRKAATTSSGSAPGTGGQLSGMDGGSNLHYGVPQVGSVCSLPR